MSFLAQLRPTTTRFAAMSVVALSVTACKLGDEPGAHVAGWTAVDARQRHPIIVSEQPANLSVRVARGTMGLTPQQRAQWPTHHGQDRAAGTGESWSPFEWSPNEVAAMHAVSDLRQIVRVSDSDANLSISPIGRRRCATAYGYARFVAEAPDAATGRPISRKIPQRAYPNSLRKRQRNPRCEDSNRRLLVRARCAKIAERRDVVWDKFVRATRRWPERRREKGQARTPGTRWHHEKKAQSMAATPTPMPVGARADGLRSQRRRGAPAR